MSDELKVEEGQVWIDKKDQHIHVAKIIDNFNLAICYYYGHDEYPRGISHTVDHIKKLGTLITHADGTPVEVELELPKYKLFEIQWEDMPVFRHPNRSREPLEVGAKVEDYRIFGFTDDPEWSGDTGVSYCSPCDETANRKYAVGRLEA